VLFNNTAPSCSIMYIVKRSGARTEPCRILQVGCLGTLQLALYMNGYPNKIETNLVQSH